MSRWGEMRSSQKTHHTEVTTSPSATGLRLRYDRLLLGRYAARRSPRVLAGGRPALLRGEGCVDELHPEPVHAVRALPFADVRLPAAAPVPLGLLQVRADDADVASSRPGPLFRAVAARTATHMFAMRVRAPCRASSTDGLICEAGSWKPYCPVSRRSMR